MAESILKWLTGGDTVRARKLHENSYEFTPTWKIILASNFKPVIRGTDAAIWSRIRLVPFDVSFEGREDKTLKTALMEELPGVLNWAIKGCLRWQKDGLKLPESVATATGEYRSESDQVGRFLMERCLVGEFVSIPARALYLGYKTWADEMGERDTMSETAFGRRMTERGFDKDRSTHGNKYRGVAFRNES